MFPCPLWTLERAYSRIVPGTRVIFGGDIDWVFPMPEMREVFFKELGADPEHMRMGLEDIRAMHGGVDAFVFVPPNIRGAP